MRHFLKMVLAVATLVISQYGCVNHDAAVAKVAQPPEKGEWLRHLLPLPHKITINGETAVNPHAISIVLQSQTGNALEKHAAKQLEDFFKKKTGVVPNGGKFDIRLRILKDSADLTTLEKNNLKKLMELPNNDQAYIITSGEGGNGLLLTALNGKGLLYASLTLRQLLETKTTRDKVVFPIVDILDWPDFNERGMWNGRTEKLAEWFVEMKLNFAKTSSKVNQFVRNKKATNKFDVELVKRGALMGINLMPSITHLNFLHRRGIFKAYPELRGKGESADAGSYMAHGNGKLSHPVPCASNPLLVKILAELMDDFAEKGVSEIGCWLTERPAQCACERCLRIGQFPLEADAFINAWRRTRKKHPDFVIRLFISTTTNQQYYKILEKLPKEVKIERACAAERGRIRHSPRDLFRNPLFDSYAKQGVWMASYDVPVIVDGAVETPEFKLPESSAVRIKDFVTQLYERGYSGAYGMFGWYHFKRRISDVNISALAEWTWNVKGRTTREFAVAWATINHLRSPEKFADWSEIMGPVEFDVFDSDFPTCYSWGKAIEMVRKGDYPRLGMGMFRYYPSPESFDDKIGKCRKAEKIAETFNDKYFLYETRVVESYARLAKAVHQAALASYKKRKQGESTAVAPIIAELNSVKKSNERAIREWRSFMGKGKWHPRILAAINATSKTCDEIIAILRAQTSKQ